MRTDPKKGETMGKRKRVLFGADFIDEDVTRKGKPRKKGASDDAENTQQFSTDEPAISDQMRQDVIARVMEAEKKAADTESSQKSASPKSNTKKKTEAPDTSDEDNYDYILTAEQARVVSVLMFAAGLLLALAVLFTGSDGWKKFHKFILGLFGFVSLVVPVVMIYSSLLIGKRKKGGGKKVGWMVLWLFVACSAFQVFFTGISAENGFWKYIKEAFKEGAKLKGGGLVGSILSYIFLHNLGRLGAIIVTLLLIFVIGLLSSGKSIPDFLKMIAQPFVFMKQCFDGVKCVLMGGDFSDAFENYYEVEDDDDAENDEQDESEINENNVEEPIRIHDSRMPFDVEEEIIYTPEERQELDEFSRMFDIPIPGENIHYADENTEPVVNENPDITDTIDNDEADSELDMIISKAVEKKKKQDRIASGEVIEEAPTTDTPMPLYILPGLELLTLPSVNTNRKEAAAEMNEKALKIVETFKSFGVEVAIRDIYPGPSITRYEIQPGVGVKVSKIRGLEDDIALNLAAQGVRMEAPVPGKSAVGIEVPNINKEVVTLREILSSSNFRNAQSKLAFAVGKDITGNAIVGDITKMPHVIIAGTTGSGKSVCTRSIIMSILYNAKPDEVKLILIDPKVVEFKVFEGIPHLLIPIVTEAKKAAGALNWAVNEMMRRYNTFAENGANDLHSYNELAMEDDELTSMPQIVIFIDELADMMLVAGKEVEDSICRLAQMGRAAGMHLVVATQRPTTDVITGLIKANIPSRIALSVMSQVDSRTIIDMAGADKLLGNGDMLYMPIGTSKPLRVQGCFASTKDITETLNFIRAQGVGEYDKRIEEAVENYMPQSKNDRGASTESGFESGSDEDLVFRSAEVAVNNGQISTTLLQRKLKLGYARASRIMDELEERGIIGPSEGSKPRKVLMSKMQFDEWKINLMGSEE